MRRSTLPTGSITGGAKSTICEFWRFIYMLMIIGHHQYFIGAVGTWHFQSGWIAVEFFFLLTGYFTVCHFERTREPERGECAKTAIQYTLRKFRRFLPYFVLAEIAEYTLDSTSIWMDTHSWTSVFQLLRNMPAELAFLSTAGFSELNLIPIWFLSAMLITLPVFCLLLLRWRKVTQYLLSWCVPILCLGCLNGCYGAAEGVPCYLRAISGMLLGCCIYMLSRAMQSINWKASGRIGLTCAEIICLAGTVALLSVDREYDAVTLKTLLLMIFTGCVIMFSGCSYTTRLNNAAVRYLGAITLPMLTFHKVAATVTNMVRFDSYWIRLLMYLGSTLVASVLLHWAVEKWKNRMEVHCI